MTPDQWTKKYSWVTTDDGSPSLAWTSTDGRVECMHSRRGAFAESVYLYQFAMQWMSERRQPPAVLSLGLGLGYNELLFASHCLSHHYKPDEIYLESFECETFLTESFLSWLRGGRQYCELHTAYEKILALIQQSHGHQPQQIKEWLYECYAMAYWRMNGALTAKTDFLRKFNIILFDAFSAKSSPELWDESFLVGFIQGASAEVCAFSTYAATGALNRALKSQNFKLLKRAGFAGKRQSTFATRY